MGSDPNNPLLPLLHQADNLQNRFHSCHATSLNYVGSLKSASVQLQNLQSLESHRRSALGSSSPVLVQRTMFRLQDGIEQALSGMSAQVSQMRKITGELRGLVDQLEVYVAHTEVMGRDIRVKSDPKADLDHLSRLADTYLGEVIRREEALRLYGASGTENGNTEGEFAIEALTAVWSELGEVGKEEGRDVDDLSEALDTWG